MELILGKYYATEYGPLVFLCGIDNLNQTCTVKLNDTTLTIHQSCLVAGPITMTTLQPPTTTQKKIKSVGDGITNLLLKKNSDYGATALKSPRLCTKLAPREGLLVRMSDKISRLENLLNNPESQQVEESIDDTIRDLAGYCILYLSCTDEKETDLS